MIPSEDPATYALGVTKLFTLFFVTLGPMKLLGPFARATAGMTTTESRAMALRAAALATLVAIVGGLLGRALLENWEVQLFAMRLTAGLILFVVAFRLVMQPYEPPAPHSAPGATVEPPNLMQVVFPMVLTPYGLAALIVLLVLSHGAGRTGVILAVLLAVMLLNLLTMAFVRPLLRTVGPVLLAIGCVLGLLQLALSVQIIVTALHGLGVVSGPA
jgi:multiple antibiotic resistance protein